MKNATKVIVSIIKPPISNKYKKMLGVSYKQQQIV